VKLGIGKKAQQQADKIEAWRVEHRPAAPVRFTDELGWTFQYFPTVRIPARQVARRPYWSTKGMIHFEDLALPVSEQLSREFSLASWRRHLHSRFHARQSRRGPKRDE
jgi:hypothetical protein